MIARAELKVEPREESKSSNGQVNVQRAAGGEHQKASELLRIIAEGTAPTTGEAFFHSLVRHLAMALKVRYACVSEFADVNSRVRTLAFWQGERSSTILSTI